MFIRKTHIRNRVTRKSYWNYQLVESVRTERGPRQRILLNLGADLELDDQERKDLANRIEEIASGFLTLLTRSDKIEAYAQKYAAMVIARLSKPQENSHGSKSNEPERDFVNIDANSIEQSDPRTVGAEHLLLKMAEQLKMSDKLKELGLSKTEIALALGSIVARAVSPDSERATYTWLCKSSGIGELLDFDFKTSSLDKLYKISDKLLVNKNALEQYLEETEAQLHGYQSTIALYDLTNVYMEGQAKSNPKAKHGVSKENRKDCPLVTLGLVMNQHGFLNRTSILQGNASEPKTLEEMIRKLDTHGNLCKPIVLLDAGIATDANLTWLKENGYEYVVSARQAAPSTDIEGELVPVGDLKNLVKAAFVKGVHGNEQWLYCESEAKAAVASQMKESFKSRYEGELKKLSDGLTKKKARKKYTKVLERIGRLKEKHKNISGCYEVNVTPSEDGKNAISIEWKVLEEKMNEKLTGKYFLRTNILKMGAKELWQLYNTLRNVEDAFRFMKSSLGLRPVHHQKEIRVDGHLWITILAYHLIQNCLYQLNKNGIDHHWPTIRKTLLGRVRVTAQAKTTDGKMLYHRSTTKAEGEQIAIYAALGLSSQILQAQKTIL